MTDGGSSAANGSHSARLATVVVKWREPHQRRDALARQGSQFRQLGQQREGRFVSHARGRLQQRFAFLPFRRAVDPLMDGPLDVLKLLGQKLQMLGDAGPHGVFASLLQAMGFGDVVGGERPPRAIPRTQTKQTTPSLIVSCSQLPARGIKRSALTPSDSRPRTHREASSESGRQRCASRPIVTSPPSPPPWAEPIEFSAEIPIEFCSGRGTRRVPAI